MAKKKLLQDFEKNALSDQESKQVKGGRNYVPVNTGSYGFINWDEVDIRDDGFTTVPNPNKLVSKTGSGGFPG